MFPVGEPLPQITGQLPSSPGLGLSGQQEARPISTFNWGCFLVTHLPDFLQQTTLNSWVPPSSRGAILVGGGQEVTRWVPGSSRLRVPKERRHCLHSTSGTGLGHFDKSPVFSYGLGV